MLQERDLKEGTCIVSTTPSGIREGIVVAIEHGVTREANYITLWGNYLNLGGSFQSDDCMDIQIGYFSGLRNCELSYIPHFCSMKNLYSVLSKYSNYFTSVDIYRIAGDFNYDFYENKCTVFRFHANNGKIIEVIVNEDTTLLPEYSNPYVWICEYDNSKDLQELNSLNGSPRHAENVSLFDIHNSKNPDIIQILDGIGLNKSGKSLSANMYGVGLESNGNTFGLINDFDNEDDRITYGTGPAFKDNF